MSGSGNWLLLCFCCCCCCRIVWVWNHYGCGFIALARGYCESLHHHRNRWIFLCSYWKKVNRWQQLEPQLLGGPGPVTQARELMPLNMTNHFLSCWFPLLLTGSSEHWPGSLKVIFLPMTFQISYSFHKARVASLSSLEKETSLTKLRIKIPRFWVLSHNLFF